jgi:hypothetical protein
MSLPDFKILPIKGERMEAEDYLFILKEFHRLLRKTLKPAVYAVFCAIEDRAGAGEQDGTPAYTCYASHTTLADDISVKRLTVFRSIKVLEEVGLIIVEEREGETSFIHPIATPEKRATYLLNHEKTSDTCIKKIQVIYPLFQNDTTPVSKRYTNGTTLKEQQKETTTKDKSLGEQSSQTEKNNILDFPSTDSPPDKASQSAHGYEQPPVESPEKSSGQVNPRNQGANGRKQNKDPAFAADPRIAIWRKYALLCHYKYWPNEQERNLIFEKIPNEEQHLARWERLIIKWIDDEHEYKIFNIKGLVKVYVNGWRKQTYASQRGSYQ